MPWLGNRVESVVRSWSDRVYMWTRVTNVGLGIIIPLKSVDHSSLPPDLEGTHPSNEGTDWAA